MIWEAFYNAGRGLTGCVRETAPGNRESSRQAPPPTDERAIHRAGEHVAATRSNEPSPATVQNVVSSHWLPWGRSRLETLAARHGGNHAEFS
jgi:hypothetical protein